MSKWDALENLGDRETIHLFADKFKSEAGAVKSATKAFEDLCEAQTGPIKTAIDQLDEVAKQALDKLKGVATKTSKGWIANKDVDAKIFEEARGAFKTSSDAVHKFLSGETGHMVDAVEVKAPEALSKAHGELTKATEAAAKIMNGWFGKARVEGWGQALKHNLNVFDKATREGRGLQMGGRVGGVAVGATMFGDALLRSKSDGEARGTFTRILEGATGLAMAGGSAFGGAAR